MRARDGISNLEMVDISFGLVGRLAQVGGVTEPAVRLFLSILIGELNAVFINHIRKFTGILSPHILYICDSILHL